MPMLFVFLGAVAVALPLLLVLGGHKVGARLLKRIQDKAEKQADNKVIMPNPQVNEPRF
ncbi:hypothetical protein LU293_04645 [Moraxella nasovis]|uniref:hypothetical protein n=1 Tax=Moraxella nasovis TaxID=2904121 RepID=UPI001F604289|nr:hypothetical protein [Moraxella nasovis]UNU74185.1 hypothetical protein LU293_04645 [Moraxella nasovis]